MRMDCSPATVSLIAGPPRAMRVALVLGMSNVVEVEPRVLLGSMISMSE